MDRYKVRVTKDYLSFAAAHFIVFNNSQCERLHGHNYRVGVEIDGALNQDFLVFDFIALKGIMRAICQELDHRMLVPVESPVFDIDAGETTVRISYEDREWVIPRDDCCLLPIENTTAELLARWFWNRLVSELKGHLANSPDGSAAISNLKVEVEESPGQSAVFEQVPDLQ